MLHLPSLKQLQYLMALEETGHFGKAASQCNVTPSTLSSSIKELEETLGVQLAERNNRSVMMTALGLEITNRARALIQDAEAIMEIAKAASRTPLSGKMTLGVIPTIGPYLLPKVLPALKDTYPDLQLYLIEDQTEQLITRLKRGEIDAALLALPYEMEGVSTAFMFNDYFQFAANPNHSLARQKSITLEELAESDLLLLAEGHCLREHALEACQLPPRAQADNFAATSLPTLIQMVIADMGVTLLPTLAAGSLASGAENLFLCPLDPPAYREIGLAWRQASHRTDEFHFLAAALTPNGVS